MSDVNKVPFLDLVAPHRELEEALVNVCRTAIETAGFIGGPMVEEFEKAFAEFCGAPYCVGVGSGTDAVRFALMAAGVRSGDAVVTVPNTFIATTEAISQAGAYPLFVDIDERTFTMSPEKLRDLFVKECAREKKTGKLIHKSTGKPVTAIVPVHLYGQMAEMDPILALAEQYGLVVVEDACQAHGAEYYSESRKAWLKAGTAGVAGAFSFYPGKNLGACGEAGAITTKDASIARKIQMLRDHGQSQKYYHDIEGYNGRLDAIQAGFLRVKLRHLAQWNHARREAAARYKDLFTAQGLQDLVPYEPAYSKSVYHLYVIRSEQREALRVALGAAGVGTGIHYPIALHLQKAYESMGYKAGDYPVAEKAAAEILSLPMYPQLTTTQQEFVVKEITKFVSSNRTAPSDSREVLFASH